jgi:uncharacterized protein (DUF111 family)
MEVTIDDSTPEEIGFLTDLLLSEGALDCFVSPVYMKKNRPGYNISVISRPEDRKRLGDKVLEESSSFGLRYWLCGRECLEREIITVETGLGEARVKIGYLNGTMVKVQPEYEDCKKIAKKKQASLREVFSLVEKQANEKLGKR